MWLDIYVVKVFEARMVRLRSPQVEARLLKLDTGKFIHLLDVPAREV